MFLRFIVNALALYLIAKYVPGFNHGATVWTALIAAIIFGLVNALIGSVLRFVTFPITFLTFGLFSVVVNYILFAIFAWLAPGFHTTGYGANHWLANLYGAVIMMVVSAVMNSTTDRQRK